MLVGSGTGGWVRARLLLWRRGSRALRFPCRDCWHAGGVLACFFRRRGSRLSPLLKSVLAGFSELVAGNSWISSAGSGSGIVVSGIARGVQCLMSDSISNSRNSLVCAAFSLSRLITFLLLISAVMHRAAVSFFDISEIRAFVVCGSGCGSGCLALWLNYC